MKNKKNKEELILALVSLTGLSLIAVGTWLIYPPAAMIVTGSILLFDNYKK